MTKSYFKYILFVFFISFVSMIIILLPNIISNKGLFLYSGDYFFQQLPFYYHAVDIVQKYGIGWDWYTDLGTDFLPSYSFYLVGSIFFWLISWLPDMIIIYAMPVMLSFKTSVAAAGAFAYIKRYVSRYEFACLGALLYAFSGYQMVNLIFNHFHDITAIFPFLLLAFDLLVSENKKGFFAFMVALTALTNYFFFYGTIVFCLLYYIVKCINKDFHFTIKSFLIIVLESIIGVGMAAIILLPVCKLLLASDRVGDLLYGVDLVSYDDNTIVPKIFQSFFIIPDPPSGGMLFKSEKNQNNWASISLYLPFFASVGVAVYLRNNSKDWISILLKMCLLMALIPGLNSIFSAFNFAYYARWYYMPVLIMALSTAKVLDDDFDLKFGIKFQSIGLLILMIISFLPDKVIKESEKMTAFFDSPENLKTEIQWFSKSSVPVVFWQCIAFSVISLLMIFVYNRERKNEKRIFNVNRLLPVMMGFSVVTYSIFINNTVLQMGFNSQESYASSIGFNPELDGSEPFRITHVSKDANNNYSMYWGRMSAGVFHSIGMNETDEFYENAQGKKRLMLSEYKEEDYPAYALLSVKYIFNRSTGDDLNVENTPVNLKGCSLYDKQGMYYIYQNDNFIPFGFMYDYCIDNDTLEKYLDEHIKENKYQYKKLAMIRALVLDEEDIEKYKDYIKPLPESMLEELDEKTYFLDCNDRRSKSCSKFEYNSNGYSAEINSDKPGLVFFSVPCSEGWSATINGNPAEIIKAHYGLTAVAVDTGFNKLEFSYKTPWLNYGIIITFISLGIWSVYMIIILLQNKNKNNSIRTGEVSNEY